MRLFRSQSNCSNNPRKYNNFAFSHLRPEGESANVEVAPAEHHKEGNDYPTYDKNNEAFVIKWCVFSYTMMHSCHSNQCFCEYLVYICFTRAETICR